MKARKIVTGSAVAGACALAGTLGGIATSSAAGSHKAKAADTSVSSGTTGASGFAGGGGRPGGRLGGGPGDQSVHSVSVVLDKAGTAYETVTTDTGTVESVDSSAITVLEGTTALPYQTVSLTIPSDATVTLDGKTSALSDLVANDHVTVSSSTDGTTVFATDSSFTPTGGGGGGFAGGGRGPGGPPPGSGSSSSGSSTSTSSSSTTSG